MNRSCIRILRISCLHPLDYLEKEKDKNSEFVQSSSFDEYQEWLYSLKIYNSDFYTDYLTRLGYKTLEVFTNDSAYVNKLCDKLLNARQGVIQKIKRRLIQPKYNLFFLFSLLINELDPQIIFVHDPSGVDHNYWRNYKHNRLIVTKVNCHFSHVCNFNPTYPDVIITRLESYEKFFKVNGTPTYKLPDGIDDRMQYEYNECKEHTVTFIGILGTKIHSERTLALERLAKHTNLSWYGPSNDNKFINVSNTSPLRSAYKGVTGGIDMFSIYNSSLICINDFANLTMRDGTNQRTAEILGSNSCLLIRDYPSIQDDLPDSTYISYSSNEELIDRVKWLVGHPDECKRIAQNGYRFARENLSYSKICTKMDEVFRHHLKAKGIFD